MALTLFQAEPVNWGNLAGRRRRAYFCFIESIPFFFKVFLRRKTLKLGKIYYQPQTSG